MANRSEKTILFLCTGNYYRSRLAGVLFNSVAGKMGLPWRASSRGLALEWGVNNVGPMAVSAVKALEALGVRAAEAVARFPIQATADDFTLADWVVALKQAEHLPLLQERFPACGRYDSATGNYIFSARDYRPTTGQWLQRDPLGQAAGDLNIGRVEGDNPTNLLDPSGLFPPPKGPNPITPPSQPKPPQASFVLPRGVVLTTSEIIQRMLKDVYKPIPIPQVLPLPAGQPPSVLIPTVNELKNKKLVAIDKEITELRLKQLALLNDSIETRPRLLAKQDELNKVLEQWFKVYNDPNLSDEEKGRQLVPIERQQKVLQNQVNLGKNALANTDKEVALIEAQIGLKQMARDKINREEPTFIWVRWPPKTGGLIMYPSQAELDALKKERDAQPWPPPPSK
jgi:protein-tyrosine phosphatase